VYFPIYKKEYTIKVPLVNNPDFVERQDNQLVVYKGEYLGLYEYHNDIQIIEWIISFNNVIAEQIDRKIIEEYIKDVQEMELPDGINYHLNSMPSILTLLRSSNTKSEAQSVTQNKLNSAYKVITISRANYQQAVSALHDFAWKLYSLIPPDKKAETLSKIGPPAYV